MFELVQVSERDYYIQSPAKIGLARTGDKSAVRLNFLIDNNMLLWQ